MASVFSGLPALFPAMASAAAPPSIVSIRMGEEQSRTRFVLDLSAEVEVKIFSLQGPDRLVIDLPTIDWRLPSESSRSGVGLVKGYRFGRFDGTTTRIVLDLTQAVRIQQMFTLPPGSGYQHRLVIDLEPGDPIAVALEANAPQTAPEAVAGAAFKVPVPIRKPKRLTLTVAIDPGHGGIDPGATGAGGALEKEIVLAVGLKLRDILKDKGYQVVMTREDDTFLPLKTRVAIARDGKADLFVSLHADSNKNASVMGASVYTLSDKASDAEAEELARKENRSDQIGGIALADENEEVSSILIELTMRETMNQSSRFARALLPHLDGEAPLLKNTHRFAGFRVLKAPDIPSVLVELGQLSNATDEKRLKDKQAQERMARAIGRAIDGYFLTDQRAELR